MVRSPIPPFAAAVAFACGLLAAGGAPAAAQQVPDSTFDVSVAAPAYARDRGPRLLIDEAHHNFHTSKGRYRPFAELARNDGYRVVGNVVPFSTSTLVGQSVLVISNAMGAEDMSDSAASRSAFTPDEIAAVREWVRGGGGLLLIADHAPFGAAARDLAAAFDVDMRNAYTLDKRRAVRRGPPGILTFRAGAGLDTAHVTVRGSAPSERVRAVTTFTGQSLLGPRGSVALLALSNGAQDVNVTPADMAAGVDPAHAPRTKARGRAQAVAFTLGRGHVVVLGEAAMFSAQRAGPDGSLRIGMNAGGNDNKQFALNVLRWLSGALR